MSTFVQDLRFGLRMAARSPGFTAVAVLTLAIGIGVNTTIFSWVDMIMLRPIPGAVHGGDLVAFESVGPDGGPLATSWPDFRDYRDHLQLVNGLAAAIPAPTVNLGQGDHVERIWGEQVSGNFFHVLGVKAALGRTFSQQECGDQTDSCAVAVISDGL